MYRAYSATILMVVFGWSGSLVIISTRGLERAVFNNFFSAVTFSLADSPGCSVCLLSDTCKPTVNICRLFIFSSDLPSLRITTSPFSFFFVSNLPRLSSAVDR